jgi:hypothetical protein
MSNYDPVTALRCRDDILQSMYWMRGEGFGDEHDEAGLAVFLVVEPDLLGEQLAVLVEDGCLALENGRYRLTELGVREGGRRFADEFAELLKTAHGECGPDCPYCKGVTGEDCPHCAVAGIAVSTA